MQDVVRKANLLPRAPKGCAVTRDQVWLFVNLFSFKVEGWSSNISKLPSSHLRPHCTLHVFRCTFPVTIVQYRYLIDIVMLSILLSILTHPSHSISITAGWSHSLICVSIYQHLYFAYSFEQNVFHSYTVTTMSTLYLSLSALPVSLAGVIQGRQEVFQQIPNEAKAPSTCLKPGVDW